MTWNVVDQWALVTGASSGIGAEFARQLAAQGMHLILTARREDKLQELAQQLDQKHKTKTKILPLDLAADGGSMELIKQVKALDLPVKLIVNNAGFGTIGAAEGADLQEMHQMVSLNVTALTDLTYAFLPEMIGRNDGGIINVASVAGHQPVAFMGVYSASKAYVLHFTEALWAELRNTNIRLQALCPGTTRTEFFDRAGASSWLEKRSSHTPEQVVALSLKRLKSNQPVVIPGFGNKFMCFLHRIASRKRVVIESMRYFRAHGGKT